MASADHRGPTESSLPFSRMAVARRASVFLPDGAVIRHIVRGQSFSPWWRVIPIVGLFYVSPVHGYRVIAVTDEAMFVLSATRWFRWQPKELIGTFPRTIRFGPLRGFASRVTLGNDRIWLFWRFYVDARMSDADLVADTQNATLKDD